MHDEGETRNGMYTLTTLELIFVKNRFTVNLSLARENVSLWLSWTID